MEDKQSYDSKQTSVLSEEERRAFDGVTIDETGREHLKRIFVVKTVPRLMKCLMAPVLMIIFSRQFRA